MKKPENVDDYIASSTGKARVLLEELREIIKSTIPGVEEKIWYNVPFYNYYGELVGLSVSKNHVSFGFGADVIQAKDRKAIEAKGFKLGKGTMQIKFDQQVPTLEIKKILKTKAKMNKTKK